MKKFAPIFKQIKIYGLALLAVFAINYYLFDQSEMLRYNTFLNIPLFFVLVYFIKRIAPGSRRTLAFTIPISIILAILAVLGHSLAINDTFNPIFKSGGWALIKYVIIALGLYKVFSLIFISLFNLVDDYSKKKEQNEEIKEWKFFTDNKKSFFLIALVIFLCYLPCLLAFWPGFRAYDFGGEFIVLFRGQINTKHSLLYTYTLVHPIKFIYNWTGNATLCFLYFSIAQMTLCALTFSYALKFLAGNKVSKWIRLIIFFFFALWPYNALMSMMTTKDVVHALCAILFFIEFYKLCTVEGYFKKISSYIVFPLVTFLLIGTRNNAQPAFFIFAPIFLFLFRKQWKPITALILITVLMQVSWNFFQFDILKAKKDNPREAYAVFAQQMVHTARENMEELEGTQDFEDFMTILGQRDLNYSPRFGDITKDAFHTANFNEDRGKYIKLYLRWFLKYPQEYFEAFFANTIGFWAFDIENPAALPGKGVIERDAFEMKWGDFYAPADFDSKWPWLKKQYDKFASYKDVNKLPILSHVASHCFPMYAMLLCMLILLYKKNRVYITQIPFMLIWLTLLAGPVSNGRYNYLFIVLAPIVMALTAKEIKGSDVK